MRIPDVGIAKDQLLRQLVDAKVDDYDWRHGRSWSLVYYGGEDHTRFLHEVYGLYFSENALSPTAFPSLANLEREVVAMVSEMLSAPTAFGTMTSGGTESILLAMKAYRDWSRTHGRRYDAEVVLPTSAHPAFLKAAQYFDLTVRYLPLDADFRADVNALEGLMSDRTIAVVASAPCYPYGVIDPIEEMAEVCAKNGVGLHVDACLGGFLLPFLEREGFPVRKFDFQVPGVTSISADLHKNGYTAKGASVVLYRDADLFEQQFFVSTDWPGGLYGSPTMLGTRPGGAVAAAWAAIKALGKKGYTENALQTMQVAKQLQDGIRAMDEVEILGTPDMSVFAFRCTNLNTFAIAERMHAMGWRLDRQGNPDAIHLIATPNHAQAVQPFLQNLRRALADETAQPSELDEAGEAMLYGVTSRARAGENLETSMRHEMRERYGMPKNAD